MELTESKFIDGIQITVNSLIKNLSDSPISLKSRLDFNLGYAVGFCTAKGWNSKKTNDFLSWFYEEVNSR